MEQTVQDWIGFHQGVLVVAVGRVGSHHAMGTNTYKPLVLKNLYS